ncbi:radical SAM protein [Gleimia sp. 6138-11-ORH1]|uniref:radical SAM/SPASM domain-containing protein n=1 Tax=Gleimia sp. 6138-11-ORH1 TaxID=2973937 RepID=UPI0021695762|nr:radical SAM protein [Gleimia sp. 6138-11-ORH1]MCS4484007.1 radical SAM protein [Gleimia sp. 6138-11-ORH1]
MTEEPACFTNEHLRIPRTTVERMSVELTANCNLRYLHCYGNFLPTRTQELDFARLQETIYSARELEICQIDLTGGEPLIYSHINEIIELIRNEKFIYSIFTNLTHLPESTFDVLRSYKPSAIITSLESRDSSIHDNFRKGHRAYDKTVSSIKRLIKAGINVKVNLVIGAHNVLTFSETVSWLSDLGVREIVVDTLRVEGRATKNLMAPDKMIREIFRRLPKQKSWLTSQTYPCGIASEMVYISSAGKILLCPSLNRPQFELGDIAQGDFNLADAVMDLPIRFSRFHKSTCRPHCAMFDRCTGGCPANSFLQGRDPSGPDLDVCSRYFDHV